MAKMTDAHKQALAEGRRVANDVRAYIEALDAHKPRRGRRRTPDSIRKRLSTIAKEVEDANPLRKVQLIQERIDLEKELNHLQSAGDLEEAKKRFVRSAKPYSKTKGITYGAWRDIGVPAELLREAGINRGFDPSR